MDLSYSRSQCACPLPMVSMISRTFRNSAACASRRALLAAHCAFSVSSRFSGNCRQFGLKRGSRDLHMQATTSAEQWLALTAGSRERKPQHEKAVNQDGCTIHCICSSLNMALSKPGKPSWGGGQHYARFKHCPHQQLPVTEHAARCPHLMMAPTTSLCKSGQKPNGPTLISRVSSS